MKLVYAAALTLASLAFAKSAHYQFETGGTGSHLDPVVVRGDVEFTFQRGDLDTNACPWNYRDPAKAKETYWLKVTNLSGQTKEITPNAISFTTNDARYPSPETWSPGVSIRLTPGESKTLEWHTGCVLGMAQTFRIDADIATSGPKRPKRDPIVAYFDPSMERWGFRHQRTHRIVLAPKFSILENPSEGLALASLPEADGYGYVDVHGNVLIPMRYKNVPDGVHTMFTFQHGRAWVCDTLDGPSCHYIDKHGRTVGAGPISEESLPYFKPALESAKHHKPARHGSRSAPISSSSCKGCAGKAL